MSNQIILRRLALVALAGFLLFLAPVGLDAAHSMSSFRAAENPELENAKKLFRSGETDKAMAILEKLVAASTLSQPDRIEALKYLAFSNVIKKNYARVKENFVEILRLQPDYKPGESLLSHTGLMRSYYEARKQVAGNLWEAAPESGIKTVTVLDFDNNSIDDVERLANFGKGLADILITHLTGLSKLKVVDRERIQFVLDEMARSESGLGGKRVIDPEFAVRLGKLMGAQSVLIGSFMKVGKKLRIDVRLVKTETSEVLKADFVDGSQDEIFDLAKKLTVKVAQNLDVAIGKDDQQNLERLQPKAVPMEATMMYAEALDMLDQERYAEAQKLLEKALALAPDFQLAQEKVKMLQTFAKG